MSSSAVTGRTVNHYLAQVFGGTTVALEHRFYGESQPFDSLATEHLDLLTSRQALHDLAQFQQWYVAERNLTGAVFCLGGSYPGNLAAWYRLEFPDLTAGCWSASGPVHAQEDWPGFGQKVWEAMSTTKFNTQDDEPAKKLYLGYQRLAELIQDGTPGASIAVQQRLNACPGSLTSQADRDNWEMSITTYPGLIMQYNNTYPVHLADIKTVVQAASTPLDAAFAVTDFLNVTKSAEGGCVDLGASAFYRSLMNATLPLSGQGNAMRTWTWQTCNEFGYFQTARAEFGHTNFYTRGASSRALWQQVCNDVFGITNEDVGARIQKTNDYYGGKNPANISHVFFSNGHLDAWSLLSVTSYPENNRNVETMVADLGSHCVGLYAPDSSEVVGATNIRTRAIQLFQSWGDLKVAIV